MLQCWTAFVFSHGFYLFSSRPQTGDCCSGLQQTSTRWALIGRDADCCIVYTCVWSSFSLLGTQTQEGGQPQALAQVLLNSLTVSCCQLFFRNVYTRFALLYSLIFFFFFFFGGILHVQDLLFCPDFTVMPKTKHGPVSLAHWSCDQWWVWLPGHVISSGCGYLIMWSAVGVVTWSCDQCGCGYLSCNAVSLSHLGEPRWPFLAGQLWIHLVSGSTYVR